MDTTQCEAIGCRHSSKGLRSAERNRPMSVFKRGSKWSYDFWVNGKRYRGSIPEARVKAQAERAENAIRFQVYQGRYGKRETPAPFCGISSPTPFYLGLKLTNERDYMMNLAHVR